MSACPRCGSALSEQALGAIIVDGCGSCGGLWFEADELGQLASSGQRIVAWAEKVFEPAASEERVDQRATACPRCGVPLYGFEFKHTPGVKLDACPRCRGIWVDDQELGAIAQGMGSPQQSPAGPRPVRQRARQAVAFMQQFPCRRCEEPNPAGSLVCWACGAPLRGRRGAMLCPRCDHCLFCKAADISGLDLDIDAHVDHCEGCGGVWVGLEDLTSLTELSTGWLEAWQEHLSAMIQGGAPAHEHDILCPICHIVLDERAYGADSGVYVDRCRTCQGTWLDDGELVLIRRVSMQQDVWRGSL
jgi:Zn-finger nucleic acid-binding protein